MVREELEAHCGHDNALKERDNKKPCWTLLLLPAILTLSGAFFESHLVW